MSELTELEKRLGITEADKLRAQAPPPPFVFPAYTPVQKGVRASKDFARIKALPRRPVPDRAELEALADQWTTRLKTPAGTMRLRPMQAFAIENLAQTGLFAPMGVGQGKTLVGLLMGTVRNSRCHLYLTQPGLLAQLYRDMRALSYHWQISCNITHLVSYAQLSAASGVSLFEDLRPETIFADEAHALRNMSSARTKRFISYLKANFDQVKFAPASGSMTTHSLRDYAHLCGIALDDGAPTPHDPHAIANWARALDSRLGPDETRLEPGVLLEFCEPGEGPRAGFRRRLVETPGVVATTDSALATGLEIYAQSPEELENMATDAALCVDNWKGVELEPMQAASVQRQLSVGFYYKWQWPNNVIDTEWLNARNTWTRHVRQYLEPAARPGCDSPALVETATRNQETTSKLVSSLAAWDAVKSRPAPPVEPIWLHKKALLTYVRNWLREGKGSDVRSIIWYGHRAVGQVLAHALSSGGVCALFLEPGEDASKSCAKNLILSSKAYGTGQNLQAYSRNLVLTPPTSGADWEQLIGRTHRPGQEQDTVTFDVLQHSARYKYALRVARGDARYIEQTTGAQQKLNLATFVGF